MILKLKSGISLRSPDVFDCAGCHQCRHIKKATSFQAQQMNDRREERVSDRRV